MTPPPRFPALALALLWYGPAVAQVYNLQNYGANVGIGSDDTAAVQAWINDALTHGGGRLYAPRPVASYRVSGITIDNSGTNDTGVFLEIYGDGRGQTKFKPIMVAGVPMFSFSAASLQIGKIYLHDFGVLDVTGGPLNGNDAIVFSNQQAVIIERLRISSGVGGVASTYRGFVFNTSYAFKITDTDIVGTAAQAILANDYSANAARIVNGHFLNNGLAYSANAIQFTYGFGAYVASGNFGGNAGDVDLGSTIGTTIEANDMEGPVGGLWRINANGIAYAPVIRVNYIKGPAASGTLSYVTNMQFIQNTLDGTSLYLGTGTTGARVCGNILLNGSTLPSQPTAVC
jgi:hypothetical protein